MLPDPVEVDPALTRELWPWGTPGVAVRGPGCDPIGSAPCPPVSSLRLLGLLHVRTHVGHQVAHLLGFVARDAGEEPAAGVPRGPDAAGRLLGGIARAGQAESLAARIAVSTSVTLRKRQTSSAKRQAPVVKSQSSRASRPATRRPGVPETAEVLRRLALPWTAGCGIGFSRRVESAGSSDRAGRGPRRWCVRCRRWPAGRGGLRGAGRGRGPFGRLGPRGLADRRRLGPGQHLEPVGDGAGREPGPRSVPSISERAYASTQSVSSARCAGIAQPSPDLDPRPVTRRPARLGQQSQFVASGLGPAVPGPARPCSGRGTAAPVDSTRSPRRAVGATVARGRARAHRRAQARAVAPCDPPARG